LRYFQLVEGLRPDVRIDMLIFSPADNVPATVYDLVNVQAGCRPIYITSLNPASFPIEKWESTFVISPEANIFHLIPKTPRPRLAYVLTWMII
jgi:hypothetical protein